MTVCVGYYKNGWGRKGNRMRLHFTFFYAKTVPKRKWENGLTNTYALLTEKLMLAAIIFRDTRIYIFAYFPKTIVSMTVVWTYFGETWIDIATDLQKLVDIRRIPGVGERSRYDHEKVCWDVGSLVFSFQWETREWVNDHRRKKHEHTISHERWIRMKHNVIQWMNEFRVRKGTTHKYIILSLIF